MQKKIICLIIIILIIIGINVNTFAFDLLTNVAQENLEKNQLKISLQVSDLEENVDGINAVSGKLIFDPNVFEKVSLTGVNNWSCVYNDEEGNENRGKFVLITTSGNVNKDTEVANIEFELKHNVNNIQTQIKIEQLQTSYHSEKITAEDKLINIEIKDNTIKLIDKKINKDITNEFKNYGIYIIIAIVAIIILVFLIIKYKERKTNEK